jgi:hypothetical protein
MRASISRTTDRDGKGKGDIFDRTGVAFCTYFKCRKIPVEEKTCARMLTGFGLWRGETLFDRTKFWREIVAFCEVAHKIELGYTSRTE